MDYVARPIWDEAASTNSFKNKTHILQQNIWLLKSKGSPWLCTHRNTTSSMTFQKCNNILYALMLYHGHSLCFFILWKRKKHNEKLANSRPSKSRMITSWDYLIYHEIKYEMLLLNGDILVHQGSYIYSSEHTLIIILSWCFIHNNEIVIFLAGGSAEDNWIIHTLEDG